MWPQHATFRHLCNAYVCYIQKHVCASCYVIFDGYSDGPSTKSMEQERRAMNAQSSGMQFLEDMTVTVRQEHQFKEQGYIYPCIGRSRGHWLITWKGLVFKWNIICRHTNRSTAIEMSPIIHVVIVGTDVDYADTSVILIQPYLPLQAWQWKVSQQRVQHQWCQGKYAWFE